MCALLGIFDALDSRRSRCMLKEQTLTKFLAAEVFVCIKKRFTITHDCYNITNIGINLKAKVIGEEMDFGTWIVDF